MAKEDVEELLIDYDIIAYEMGHKADNQVYVYPEIEEFFWNKIEADHFVKFNQLDPELLEITYRTEPLETVKLWIDDKIEEILSFFPNLKDYKGFLTGKNNFRYKIATIQRYKGNRVDTRKPRLIQEIRQYLIDSHKAVETYGEEADDALGYSQTNKTCICSTDKDMCTIPGNHFIWGTKWNNQTPKFFHVSLVEALRSFYCQLIIGDTSDNILGLFGISKGSTYLKKIQEMEDEQDMFDLVYALYKQRFGNYAELFILETGRLLRIRQTEGEMWNFPEYRT